MDELDAYSRTVSAVAAELQAVGLQAVEIRGAPPAPEQVLALSVQRARPRQGAR